MKKLLLTLLLLSVSIVADAKTVAWYRFEEEPSGTVTTGDMIFTNTVDAAKYPAYARVCTANGNNKFNPANPTVLQTTAERMPIYTNAFPATVSLYDNIGVNGKPGGEYDNNSAIDLRNLPDNNNNPSGLVLIDDHADLRLKRFTLEFFMRSDDSTVGWRTLAVRTASKYSTKETFRIYGQLYTSGTMYLAGEVRSFLVTNEVTGVGKYMNNTIRAHAAEATVDQNRWHHIALTVDDEKKEAAVYIDYVRRGKTTYEGDLFYEEGYPFAFGGDPQCNYFNMFMQIDEIRISDEVLEPSQFLQYGYRRDTAATEAVDDDTLFFFDFNGSTTPVTVGDGDMHLLRTYTPFLVNKARNPLYAQTHAQLYNHSASYTNYVGPTANTAEVPNTGSRFGLLGVKTTENTASCHIITNSPANDQASRIILPSTVTKEDLFSDSLTIEGYFMIPKKEDLYGISKKLSNSLVFCMRGGFTIQLGGNPTAWTYGYFTSVTIGNKELHKNGKEGNNSNISSKSYADGKWHHFALVYDKDGAENHFYVDNSLQFSYYGEVSLYEGNSSYIKYFIMGDSYWGDHYSTNFRFDDVRITCGALRPYQFLTTIPLDVTDHYADASFENGFVMQPYTNFFGNAGTAGAFTAGGAVPTCVKDRPAKILTAGRKGPVITEENNRSVRIDGGMIHYPNRALMADGTDFTVQFFVKMNEIESGAGIARVNRGSATDVTNTVTWALSFADAAGNLTLKVDTDAAENQTHTFPAALGTGFWNHIGLQFMTEDGNSVVRLYKDRELVDTWTLDGKILTRPRLMNFMLGAGENTAAAFDGWIDEFRVTPGFVPATGFMYPKNPGFAVLLK